MGFESGSITFRRFAVVGNAPDQVNEEMLAKVGSTPGAIGYLTRSKMDGSVNVLHVK